MNQPAEKTDGRLRRAETEKRILGATVELLDAGAPLAGLSVNKIAETAGVSRATFYLHFNDKRALVSRLADTELQEFQRVTGTFLSNPAAGRDELAETTRALVAQWREHAGVLSSLIELSEYDADAREDWQRIIHAVAEGIAPAIRDRSPGIDEPMVLTIADIVAWMGERALHQMIGRSATDAQANAVADGLTEAVWRIITP